MFRLFSILCLLKFVLSQEPSVNEANGFPATTLSSTDEAATTSIDIGSATAASSRPLGALLSQLAGRSGFAVAQIRGKCGILHFTRTNELQSQFAPQCTENGHFKLIQCNPSTKFCWCVDPETGAHVNDSATPPNQKPHCNDCYVRKAKFLETDAPSKFSHRCTKDGSFAEKLVNKTFHTTTVTTEAGSTIADQSSTEASSTASAGLDNNAHLTSQAVLIQNTTNIAEGAAAEPLPTLTNLPDSTPVTAAELESTTSLRISSPSPLIQHKGTTKKIPKLAASAQPSIDAAATKVTKHSRPSVARSTFTPIAEPEPIPSENTSPLQEETTTSNGQNEIDNSSATAAGPFSTLSPFWPTASAQTTIDQAFTTQIVPIVTTENADEKAELGSIDAKADAGNCTRMRTQFIQQTVGTQPRGVYIPQCTHRGYFKLVQCHTAAQNCWCVDPETNTKVENSAIHTSKGSPSCNGCFVVKSKLLETGAAATAQSVELGLHSGPPLPKCTADGFFVRVQCDATKSDCWCVDEVTGREIAGTHKSAAQEPLVCDDSLYQSKAVNNSKSHSDVVGVQVEDVASPPPTNASLPHKIVVANFAQASSIVDKNSSWSADAHCANQTFPFRASKASFYINSTESCADVRCPKGFFCRQSANPAGAKLFVCCNKTYDAFVNDVNTCPNDNTAYEVEVSVDASSAHEVFRYVIYSDTCATLECPPTFDCVQTKFAAKCCNRERKISLLVPSDDLTNVTACRDGGPRLVKPTGETLMCIGSGCTHKSFCWNNETASALCCPKQPESSAQNLTCPNGAPSIEGPAGEKLLCLDDSCPNNRFSWNNETSSLVCNRDTTLETQTTSEAPSSLSAVEANATQISRDETSTNGDNSTFANETPANGNNSTLANETPANGENSTLANETPANGENSTFADETPASTTANSESTETSNAGNATEAVANCLQQRLSVLNGTAGDDAFMPQCTANGDFEAVQCHSSKSSCWCVEKETGKKIPLTETFIEEIKPNCTLHSTGFTFENSTKRSVE